MSNVGYGTLQIIPSAKGFAAGLNKEVSGPLASVGNKEGKSAGGKFRTGVLGSLKGMAGPMAALVGGAAVLGFFKDAVAGASDLSESTSKVGVVFKGAAGQILAASKTSATGMGLSKEAYLSATGSLGNLLVSLNLAPKKAADMSQQMVKLAGDLASFNNVSPEEALAALQSGLTGETEPLKKFGVNMNDATLKAQALKMGLIKNTKEALTPQNKALAAQALIMAQTKTAQGDFARTSGGLANQQRILSAQFSDVKAKIGGALLPVVTKLFTWVNKMVPVVVKFGKSLADKVGPAVGKVAAAIKGFFSGFGSGQSSAVFGIFKNLARVVTGTIIPAVKSLVTYLAGKLGPIFAAIGKIIVQDVVPAVVSLGRFITGTLLPAVVGIILKIAGKLKPVLDAFYGVIQTRVIPAIALIAQKFKEWQPTIQKVISVVVLIVGKVLEFAAAILGKVLPVVIKLAGWLVTFLVKAIISTIETVAKIIGKVIEFGVALFNAGAKVVQFVKDTISFFTGLPGKIATALGDAASFLVQKGKDFLTGLLNGIKTAAVNVYTFYSELRGKIADKIGDAVTWLVQKGKDFLTGLLNGIKTAAVNVYTFYSALGGKIASKVGNAASFLVQKGKDFLTGLKNGASAGFSAVNSFMGGIPGKVVSALGNVGSILYNAGAKIISGLVDGLRAKVGDVTSFLKNLTSKIPDWKGPAKTDKTLLTPTGAMIIAGLVNGMKSGEKGVKSYLSVVTKQIAGIWSSRVTAANDATKAAKASITRLNALAAAAANGSKAEKNYKAQAAAAKRLADVRQAYADKLKTQAKDAQRAITTASAGMLKQAALHDTIIAKLTEARKKLSDLIAVRNEYATGIADSLKATASLTSFQPEEGKAPTIGNLKTFLTDRLAAIKKFAADMATLRKKGVSDTIIKDLESKGIEASATTAAALAAGSKTDIAQINSLQAAVDAQANLAGKQAAAKWFDTGINAAQGVVKGIESQLKSVDAVGVKLAKTLADAIRNALKIKSPSRVLKKLGSFSGQGLTVGLEGERRRVYAASAGLAKAVVAGSKGLPIASASHAGAVSSAGTRAVAGNDIDINVIGQNDPEATARVVARKLVNLGV